MDQLVGPLGCEGIYYYVSSKAWPKYKNINNYKKTELYHSN